MSNTTSPIVPRENADTAAVDIGTNTTEITEAPADNGHPVTSTILRNDGEACYAHDAARGGTWAFDANLTRSFAGGNWRGTIRATFAPRTDREAANPQGRELLAPIVMEAVFYGSFREAHRIMRAAVAAVAHKREAQAAKSRRRRAAKAAQNAPEGVDAANASPEDAERF